VPPYAIWRRLRHPFSISAPRMTVRTQLGWKLRIALVGILIALIGGMWWWGFDFGQIFSGLHRGQMVDRLAQLETDNAKLTADAEESRKRAMQLESDVAIAHGAQISLTRQNQDLMSENAQMKEELAFVQQLVSDSSKEPGLAIQRLTLDHDHDDSWHYSLLIVRGGNPRDEFAGHVVLQAVVTTPAAGNGTIARQDTITVPASPADGATPLDLKFKYYQRLEGTLQVPPGVKLVSVTARAFEEGSTTPRATRTLTNP
jgi:hypothetical protein